MCGEFVVGYLYQIYNLGKVVIFIAILNGDSYTRQGGNKYGRKGKIK